MVAFKTFSQVVDSVVFFPPNPTYNDTVTILCYVKYPSVGCQVVSKESYYGFNNSIILKAFHCGGPISMICYTVDTFIVPMPKYFPGTYTIYYMPGFVTEYPCQFPMPNGDTIPYPSTVYSKEIVVSPPLNININKVQNKFINVFPNPASVQITVTGYYSLPATIRIYDIAGKLLLNKNLASHYEQIDIHALPLGIFIYQLTDASGNCLRGKLAVE